MGRFSSNISRYFYLISSVGGVYGNASISSELVFVIACVLFYEFCLNKCKVKENVEMG